MNKDGLSDAALSDAYRFVLIDANLGVFSFPTSYINDHLARIVTINVGDENVYISDVIRNERVGVYRR